MSKSATNTAKGKPSAEPEPEITVLSLDDISEPEERETLESLCIAYREESARERSAKAAKEALMGTIAPLAEKLGVERGKAKIVAAPDEDSRAAGWELVQRTSSRTEVDPKRLLARGVSMEDIMYATIKKETAYYTVVEVKS